ncbi:uncharacterized protein FRV6_10113 [Fusarium oxysporum]|uniref:Uncharacterized protein n=1 Tax=Fusarium oxysporum TaxID=5507 RepID=A0A2H3TRV9_FUSOX|nr:uncharacterized protein FRV6_10113 [Fusarium oxysporum]
MPRDEYPSANQALFTPGYNTEWNPVPSFPMPTLQSNALAESDGWPQFLGPAAALSVSTPDIMAKVGDFNYAQRLNSFNLNAPVPTGHPSAMGEVGNYNQEFTSYMPSVHPNGNYGMKMPLTLPPLTEPHLFWDNFLMNLKAQGLGYSAIQDEMRKEFGWTRNKNVLVKRFAVLKKRCKPQIKTRIVRDISKRITPEIIKAVGKELEKVTSSGSNSIAAELEDLVPLRLPEFLERLVADVGVSLHQIVEDDKRSSA